MGLLFYILKLGFIAGELLSLYIEATYLFVILPFAGAAGRSEEANALIIGLNLVMGLGFFFLH